MTRILGAAFIGLVLGFLAGRISVEEATQPVGESHRLPSQRDQADAPPSSHNGNRPAALA